MSRKPILDIKVLPGQPLDGTGRVCIHLFVQDPKGPFTEPHALQMEEVTTPSGDTTKQLVAKETKGRLACDPKRLVALKTTKGVTTVTIRSDDPRAVTCPKCIESEFYKHIMNILSGV